LIHCVRIEDTNTVVTKHAVLYLIALYHKN